jgi:dTDP-4-amino-4,6-dideoxygalactose transaminase
MLPAVLGGQPTWLPKGPVTWDRWGGTAPSWDLYRNALDPDAIPWPMVTVQDALSVMQAVAGTWAFNGPIEREVSEEIARRKGIPYVELVSSGSVAIYILIEALMARACLRGRVVEGVGEVIVTEETFAASGSMIALCGLKPVVVDVDPGTLVPSVEAIAAAITPNTVGILVVVLYAGVTPLDGCRQLADEHDLWLAVDGAQAPFARYQGRPLAEIADGETGSTQLGKRYTSGEGGWVATSDPLVAALCRYAVVGKTPDPLPSWWPTSDLERIRTRLGARTVGVQGQNWRMTEPQAALLRSQLLLFDAQEERQEEQYRRFVRRLRRLDLPYDLVQRTPQATGILYKAALWNRTQIPTGHLMYAIRRQITGECNPPYFAMSDPRGGLVLDTAPWQFGHLGVKLDLAGHRIGASAHDQVFCFSHDLFLRYHGADHAIAALQVTAAHQDQLAHWAQKNPLLA